MEPNIIDFYFNVEAKEFNPTLLNTQNDADNLYSNIVNVSAPNLSGFEEFFNMTQDQHKEIESIKEGFSHEIIVAAKRPEENFKNETKSAEIQRKEKLIIPLKDFKNENTFFISEEKSMSDFKPAQNDSNNPVGENILNKPAESPNIA